MRAGFFRLSGGLVAAVALVALAFPVWAPVSAGAAQVVGARFAVVGNYWALGGPDQYVRAYTANRVAASYEPATRSYPMYRIVIQMATDSGHNLFFELESVHPFAVGSYYSKPRSKFFLDYAADGLDHDKAVGVARVRQVHVGRGGQVQLAVTFAFRDAGQTRPFYGAVGYDTSVRLIVPGETAKERFGDFNGDGRTDIAVYRPSTGVWYIRGRHDVHYGKPGDIPVPGDYNGNGKTEIAVYRPTTGMWYIRDLPDVHYGGEPGDIPAPGDYNGDGKTDIAFFRPSTGTWHIRGQPPIRYGKRGDLLAQSDYNGDGKTDIAVFNPFTDTTHIRGQNPVTFGKAGDIPVPAYYPNYGDPAPYHNDGRSDVALYRPLTGTWLIHNVGTIPLGSPADMPVPGDWNQPNDYRFEPAVYDPHAGTYSTWRLETAYGVTVISYGRAGDVPV